MLRGGLNRIGQPACLRRHRHRRETKGGEGAQRSVVGTWLPTKVLGLAMDGLDDRPCAVMGVRAQIRAPMPAGLSALCNAELQ